MTDEDIRNIPQFKDQTLIAIKAPSGSTLAVPYPDQAAQTLEELKYQIFLNSREGPVEIYVVSSSRDDEGRCLFLSAPACTCAAACHDMHPWVSCHSPLSCVPCQNCVCARHCFAARHFRPDKDVILLGRPPPTWRCSDDSGDHDAPMDHTQVGQWPQSFDGGFLKHEMSPPLQEGGDKGWQTGGFSDFYCGSS